jgi:hypothetical protein
LEPANAKIQLMALCVEGWAKVFLFVYVGDDDESFDPEECKGCTMPSDNSTDIVWYYFEFNCDCEIKESPEPTPAPKAERTCEEPECLESSSAEVDLEVGPSRSCRTRETQSPSRFLNCGIPTERPQ